MAPSGAATARSGNHLLRKLMGPLLRDMDCHTSEIANYAEWIRSGGQLLTRGTAPDDNPAPLRRRRARCLGAAGQGTRLTPAEPSERGRRHPSTKHAVPGQTLSTPAALFTSFRGHGTPKNPLVMTMATTCSCVGHIQPVGQRHAGCLGRGAKEWGVES